MNHTPLEKELLEALMRIRERADKAVASDGTRYPYEIDVVYMMAHTAITKAEGRTP